MSEIETGTQTQHVFKQLDRIDYSKMELTEEVIQLNRVAKVVKGGRRFSFSALVVVGDKNGHVGLGFGKANEVPESIQKGVMDAKKNLIRVPRIGRTVPYQVTGAYSAARVLLKPASEGTGIIASAAVRSVLELGGIHDVLTKNLGSKNVINILKAVIAGLKSIRDAEEVMRLRGKNLEDIVGKGRAKALRQSNQIAAAEEKKISGSKLKDSGFKPYSTEQVVVISEEEMSAKPKTLAPKVFIEDDMQKPEDTVLEPAPEETPEV